MHNLIWGLIYVAKNRDVRRELAFSLASFLSRMDFSFDRLTNIYIEIGYYNPIIAHGIKLAGRYLPLCLGYVIAAQNT